MLFSFKKFCEEYLEDKLRVTEKEEAIQTVFSVTLCLCGELP